MIISNNFRILEFQAEFSMPRGFFWLWQPSRGAFGSQGIKSLLPFLPDCSVGSRRELANLGFMFRRWLGPQISSTRNRPKYNIWRDESAFSQRPEFEFAGDARA